jgi:hypothetical protein
MKKVNIYPFNERGNLENVKNCRAMIVAEKLNSGIKLIPVDQLWLTENVNNNSYFKDSVPVLGVRFDFSDFLNTYIVLQFDQWHEYKAYNKTSLRAILYGKIDKIVQIN